METEIKGKPTRGTPTKAKDGVTYRSMFEANFVNKILIPSGMDYEYEKPYPDTERNWLSDFYLPEVDIFIECVYHGIQFKHEYEIRPGEIGKIHLNVMYEEKDYAKKNGARWNPDLKTWYVDAYYMNPKLHQFVPYDKKELLEKRMLLTDSGKSLSDEYNRRLYEKIVNRYNVIVVTYTDLKKHSELWKIVSKKAGATMRAQLFKHALTKNIEHTEDVGSKSTRVSQATAR